MRNSPLKAKSERTARRDRQVAPVAREARRDPCFLCLYDHGIKKPSAHAHHLYGKGAYPSLAKEPLNVIGLCAFCHPFADLNRERVREKVAAVFPERMEALDRLAFESRSQGRESA